MNFWRGHVAVASILALLVVSGCAGRDGSPATSETAPTVASNSGPDSVTLAASQAFLATLTPDQRSAVLAERTAANLEQWSNLPDGIYQRAGLRMDSLDDSQRKAALSVLAAALSPDGYRQVTQITTADGVLASTATGEHPDFGADHYWIRFVGQPSAASAYTIQYGGHHLALNITVKGPAMTIAPTLWGAQPATYAEGASEVEPLSGETRKAFAVMDSLTREQQQEAILDAPMREIVLGAGKDGTTLAPEGVKAANFTADQKAKLLDLVTEWLTTLNQQDSAAKIDAATAEVDQMTFAWSGETTLGNPIYYRVQSPAFVIEFAHQQGEGPQAGGITHIHSIYREIGNDYAGETGP